ncbi:uncharacterized protein F5147DRAFT_159488 [Suillus discolor]|uniref:Uncharacterized protein n=1 Tax=Suillus discolor TaxID=1912936 RepID=A0A9P7F8X4_9AGAM|nr:uncharacterized protein F5147DRAFT_159488 [Suillus discolor]KAG2108936.1 hypothetical protein F5147DRAFT_159488 [Suillus discolor]
MTTGGKIHSYTKHRLQNGQDLSLMTCRPLSLTRTTCLRFQGIPRQWLLSIAGITLCMAGTQRVMTSVISMLLPDSLRTTPHSTILIHLPSTIGLSTIRSCSLTTWILLAMFPNRAPSRVTLTLSMTVHQNRIHLAACLFASGMMVTVHATRPP